MRFERSDRPFRLIVGVLLALVMLAVHPTAQADHGTGGSQSFTFLQGGFTQDLFGVSPHFMGGVAFAPDGDPVVDDCGGGNGELHRYDRQGAPISINGSAIHPETVVPSAAGCGLTNHPDGTLYSNTFDGIANIDADTGVLLRGPFGSGGNALGITPDPLTGDLVYVGLDGTIYAVDAAFTIERVFSTETQFNFVDGIFFDPSGEFLFLANRAPEFRMTVLRRDGSLVQHQVMPSEPDGISFHATSPKFVVTANTDGTMTRFDFPGDDYTQTPAVSSFASGGFRSDLTQVGADGCIYVTQDGTRYADGSISSQNSLVRICGGFAPPPGVEGTSGRMTGGGWIAGGLKVTHGFTLRCGETGPSELQINWPGNSFHLEQLTSISCSDDASFDEGNPVAGLDTVVGSGVGRCNQEPAVVNWRFTDQGEPGRSDTAEITISGACSLEIAGSLRSGNHQAHAD